MTYHPMKMVVSPDGFSCTAASLAMVTNRWLDEIIEDLYMDLDFPFDPPFDGYPKVPSMDEICDWMWKQCLQGLVPFNRNPTVSIAPGCNQVPVWYNGDRQWLDQLAYGWGLLEGFVIKKNTDPNGFLPEIRIGHLCAWDGKYVMDPRGYKYKWADREEHGFDAERFWLLV